MLSCSRNPPNSRLSSSAVPSRALSIRQFAARWDPWKMPRSVSVFPTSIARSTGSVLPFGPAGSLPGPPRLPRQEEVVDQPGPTDPGRHQSPGRPFQAFDILPGDVVDQRHVVKPGGGLRPDPLGHLGPQDVATALDR